MFCSAYGIVKEPLFLLSLLYNKLFYNLGEMFDFTKCKLSLVSCILSLYELVLGAFLLFYFNSHLFCTVKLQTS